MATAGHDDSAGGLLQDADDGRDREKSFRRQCSLGSHVPLRLAGGMICCAAKTEAS